MRVREVSLDIKISSWGINAPTAWVLSSDQWMRLSSGALLSKVPQAKKSMHWRVYTVTNCSALFYFLCYMWNTFECDSQLCTYPLIPIYTIWPQTPFGNMNRLFVCQEIESIFLHKHYLTVINDYSNGKKQCSFIVTILPPRILENYKKTKSPLSKVTW